jgi:type IV pilus assembly protein PilM
MLKHFARTSLPIGLDLSGRWFKAAQATSRGVGAKAKITRGPEPGAKGGTAATPATAVLTPGDAQVLAGTLERGGFGGNRVTVVAPRHLLYAEILELPPRASGAPLEQLARVELARSSRCEEGSFTLGMWDVPLGSGGRGGGRDQPTQVFAVGLPNERIEPVLAALEGVGLEVVAVDTPGCALARACAGLMATREAGASVEGRPLTLILDIGWGGALLVVVASTEMGRIVVYERSVTESGLHALFGAVASKLGVGEQEVELILSGAGTEAEALQAESRVCVTEYLDSLGPELQRSLSYVAHRYPGCAPLCVLVTGDGAEMALGAAVCQRLSESAAVPVVRVGLAEVAGGEAGGVGAHSSLLTALGASMHGACGAGRAAA